MSNTEADIQRLLDQLVNDATERGLGEFEDWIRAHAWPAVGFELGDQPLADVPIGGSRVGGSPDLPKGVEWPRDAEGGHYNFIAQVDLSAAPSIEGLLATGMMWFFLGDDEERDSCDGVVLHAAQPGVLSRAGTPPADQLINENYCDLQPYALTPRLCVTLPGAGSPAHLELVAAIERDDEANGTDRLSDLELEFDDLRIGAKPGFATLGGHASDVDEDPTVMMAAGEKWLDPKWMQAHADQVRNEAAEWRLLFRIGSSHDVGMCFWDYYSLAFMMKQADIVAGRFAKARALLLRD